MGRALGAKTACTYNPASRLAGLRGCLMMWRWTAHCNSHSSSDPFLILTSGFLPAVFRVIQLYGLFCHGTTSGWVCRCVCKYHPE
jgi:hypothetical protein